jgi:iron complex transport system ATP-binding protein
VSAAASPALEIEGLTVRFGARTALQAVDLTVRPGEFVGLVGPNGSGKTTLLRSVLGFQRPETGRVRLFGADAGSLRVLERARRVAWVPQEEQPRDDVPVLEYVLYGRYARTDPWRGEEAVDRDRARAAVASVDLAGRARDGILSLSGGERQRALLARAIAQEAPLLLLDEPTSHLDIGHQLDLLERVRALARERGVTVVAALHDLNLAARFADRLVVLSRGRRVADGPPDEVLSAELLERVWGVVATLRRDPRSGSPYLLPQHLLPAGTAPGALLARGPVHVIAGGGSGIEIFRALTDAGYRLTSGALPLLDSDAEAAEALGIPTVLEVPFAPLGPEAREGTRALLSAAKAIVVAPTPFGPANLANLEELRPFAGRTPILRVRPPGARRQDYVEGRADRLFEELRAGGAREVPGTTELLRALAELLPAPEGVSARSG